MSMLLTNWIDKKINDFEGSQIFTIYFERIGINKIEGTNYLSNPGKGIEIILSDTSVITSIHLFADDGTNKKYTGHIPFNLEFHMSLSAVHKILGVPNKFGGGYKDIFGSVPCWDKYYFETYSLHVQYSEDKESITLITIGSLNLEPYFNISLQ